MQFTLKWLFWLTFIVAVACAAFCAGRSIGHIEGRSEVYQSIGYIH